MPKDGYYFDVIVRQEPIDESTLDPKEWVDQKNSLYSEEELRYLKDNSKWYFENTDYALIGNFWDTGFEDIALVQGPHVIHPKGIWDLEEWYISTITRKSYIHEIYNLQYELQMKNLELYRQAVGERIEVIVMSGTDFGSQKGPFISPAAYRELYKPLHKKMNSWVHKNTRWKTFYHTCRSIVAFMDDFHEAEIDILNPVQISAEGMGAEILKKRYGHMFVFWGGGIDAQHTLPLGTPEQVREEVERNIRVFSQGGGFVFNNVHNIQAGVPVENLVAMFEAFKRHSSTLNDTSNLL